MQRSFTYKRNLKLLLFLALFLLYTALAGIHLFLPPLFALLYGIYSQAIKKSNTLMIIFVLICLLFLEAQHSFIFLSTLFYFVLLSKIFMPKIEKNLSCKNCKLFVMVVAVYVGYLLFATILSTVFMLETPSWSYYIIYYILIEFFIVSIL